MTKLRATLDVEDLKNLVEGEVVTVCVDARMCTIADLVLEDIGREAIREVLVNSYNSTLAWSELPIAPIQIKLLDELDANVKKELSALINYNSLENDSGTPDFILGEFLFDCLQVFNKATNARIKFYDSSGDKQVNDVRETKK